MRDLLAELDSRYRNSRCLIATIQTLEHLTRIHGPHQKISISCYIHIIDMSSLTFEGL